MDELVETVKDTVNRVAARPGSRSRSRAGSRTGSRMEHKRRSSEGTISSLPGISREHTYNEIESPKTEQSPSLSTSMPRVTAVMESVVSLAMQTSCLFLKAFRRKSVEQDEERGRSRLSVINELEEVTTPREAEKNQKLSAFATRRVDLSASAADVQWWWARSRLNPWRLKGPNNASPGVVIIMTEVMVTSSKKEIGEST